MPGTRDTIEVADLIVEFLKTHLPARLGAMDGEYDDGITLEQIPDANYYVAELAKLPGFPLICVIPEESDPHDLDNSGYGNYDIETHVLNIAIALTANEDEQRLKRRTGRTLRAIEEVLLENAALSGVVDMIWIGRKTYAPMLTNRSALLQEAQMTVRVMTRPNN